MELQEFKKYVTRRAAQDKLFASYLLVSPPEADEQAFGLFNKFMEVRDQEREELEDLAKVVWQEDVFVKVPLKHCPDDKYKCGEGW